MYTLDQLEQVNQDWQENPLWENERTINHMVNGGMDTTDMSALLSMTSMDGYLMMNCSELPTDTHTRSKSKEDFDPFCHETSTLPPTPK